VDPFYKFWFRYVYPNADLIDIGRGEVVQEFILEDLSNHVGPIFEEIIRQTILALSGKEVLGILFPKINSIGVWWKKDKEIDLMGAWNRKIKIIGEITWSAKPYNSKDIDEIITTIKQAGFKGAKLIIVSRGGVTRGAKHYIEEHNGIILTIKELSTIWDELYKQEKQQHIKINNKKNKNRQTL